MRQAMLVRFMNNYAGSLTNEVAFAAGVSADLDAQTAAALVALGRAEYVEQPTSPPKPQSDVQPEPAQQKQPARKAKK